MPIQDPGPAPEGGGGMRAADLKNLPIIILPHKVDQVVGKDGEPWEFIECDVWTLDRSGVVEHGERVRISWWKAMAQLLPQLGQFVACRPKNIVGNSIELAALDGPARELAAQVIADLEAKRSAVPQEPATPAPSAESLAQYDAEVF